MSTKERGLIQITGFETEAVTERESISGWEPTLDRDAKQGRLSRVWRRFKRSKLAIGGLGIIAVMFLITVFARPISVPEELPVLAGLTLQPFALAPFPPDLMDYSASHNSPSGTHLFGTDWAGRDVFSRILYGGRWSLSIGFIAVSLAVFIGVPLGAISGYYGGWVDEFIMRIVDILYAFPFLVLALAIVAILGRGYWNMILALTIVGWITYARLIRGEVLSVKENDYVLAARALGASNRSIIFRHIVPNAMAPVIVYATLSIGTVVLAAAALGFLGLGLDPGSAEWGSMLSRGQETLAQGYWWVTVFPGIAIFLFVMAINIVGDGVREAFDPQSDTSEGEFR